MKGIYVKLKIMKFQFRKSCLLKMKNIAVLLSFLRHYKCYMQVFLCKKTDNYFKNYGTDFICLNLIFKPVIYYLLFEI